jgi:PAS domain S-box-containing protein
MEIETRLARSLEAGADPTDAQFRLLVETVSDYAIYLLDTAGHVMSWNAGAERIKGYAARDIMGRAFSVFYPPEDRAAGLPERNLAQAAREGRLNASGWRVRKDGTRFWADVVITALRDRAGELTGFAKLTRDLTSSRNANERLRESEERLRAFTDNSPTVMFLKDAGGCYRFVNRPFLESFGLQAEQVIGKRDADVFPAAQAARFAAGDARVLATGAAAESEQWIGTPHGERLLMVVNFPVFDAAGGIAGVGGVATDITERKRAERSLLERRTLLAQTQSLAGLGSWEWDPATGRFTWSDELYRIFGFEPRSLEPSFETYLERVHPEDRKMSSTVVARALAEGSGFRHEERIVRPDGSERLVRTHGQIVRDEGGGALKLIAACLDVTEQRDAEAALQSLTRRLVQAEESERRRIAGELHDRVGQTLSALNINLDILLGMLGEHAPADVRMRLRDSLALVDGTLQSIENVMAELRPPLLEEYGVGAALGWHAEEFSRRTSIAIEFEDLAKQKNRELPREAGVALFRISQEALNNVAKHANARRVTLRLDVEGRDMVLTIRDDGSGFDLAQARARSSRYGMTTMKERVLAAGGQLEVDSAPGKGTTLRARVPF